MESSGGDVSGKGGLSPHRCPWASRLLSDYIVAAGEKTLQTRGIPENSIDAWTMRGITPGKKDLKAVARPFRRVARLVRRGEDDAAFRTRFVKEETRGQARGDDESSGGCRQIISRDEQQVRIEGIRANRIRTHDLKCVAVNIFERHGLLLVVFTEPVGVLRVRCQDGVVVNPTVERIHGLGRKECGGRGH